MQLIEANTRFFSIILLLQIGCAAQTDAQIDREQASIAVNPWVEGSRYPGFLLTCCVGISPGGMPVSVSYQWLRDNDEIEGAVTQIYKVTLVDVGHELTCRVRTTLLGTQNHLAENSVSIMGDHLETGLPLDANGFHDIDGIINRPGKYDEARIVYLDTAGGNDDHAKPYNKSDFELNGTPTTPVLIKAYATPKTAFAQLRSGYPDVLLIKRGTAFSHNIRWNKIAGKSADERQIISCYGDSGELPLANKAILQIYGGGGTTGSIDNILVSHLCYYDSNADPASETFENPGKTQDSVLILWPCKNLLIEGITSKFGMLNIQGHDGSVDNVMLRRCNVTDTYSTTSHQQGVFAKNVGLTIEECLFDHCGWSETVPGAKATIFNHNLYLQNSTIEVNVRENIIARGASHGIQQRCGGENFNNLYLNNPIHVLVGGGTNPMPGGARCLVHENVLLGSGDIDSKERGFGIEVSNIRSGYITENILAHQDSLSDVNDFAIRVSDTSAGVGVNDLKILNNWIWNWRGGFGIYIPPGEPFTLNRYHGITYQNNSHYEQLSKRYPLVKLNSAAEVHVSGNRYHMEDGKERFEVGKNSYRLAEFNSLMGSNDKDWVDREGSAVPTVVDYMGAIGLTGGVDEFLAHCRLQSKFHWDARFTASAFNSFIRARINFPRVSSHP